LALTWDGTQYAGSSCEIATCFAAGSAAVVGCLAIERRASEPLIPLRLFRGSIFNVSSTMAFLVGMAMFGALVYLPLFFQVVHEVSATRSGLWLLPLMGGLLVA